ncbi:MAG: type IV conjugative transfer system protein TraE [Pseudomonadota bacterium]
MLKSFVDKNLSRLIQQRNGFLIISLGLLLSNIILVVYLSHKEQKTIIVPAYFKQSFWSEGELFSPEYLEEMTLFFSQHLFNYTKENREYKRQVILRYVMPEHRQTLEKKLIQEENRLQALQATVTFHPQRVEVFDNYSAQVTGVTSSYVTGELITEQQSTFWFHYGYSNGIWLLKDFNKLSKEDE